MYRAFVRNSDPKGIPFQRSHAEWLHAHRELNVLIVDDEPADMLLMERMLAKVSSLKFKTAQAASLKSAREAFETTKFDLALVDLDIAGECGVDLVSQFQKRNCGCATVLVSGCLTPSARDKSRHAGAVASIGKNQLKADLLEIIIRQALESCRVASELRVREALIERLRRCTVDSDGALPSRLVEAMQQLIQLSSGFGHCIDTCSDVRKLTREAAELRQLVDDFEAFCQETTLMFASVADAPKRLVTVDLQALVLDAVSAVGCLGRQLGVAIRVGLVDGPLRVRTEESTLCLALIDLLTVALGRCMPGSVLRVDLRAHGQNVDVTLRCDDVILRNRRVTLQNSYLLTRCDTLLDRCEAALEITASTVTEPQLGRLRLECAGETGRPGGDGALGCRGNIPGISIICTG